MMNLREVYTQLEGSYDKMIHRLRREAMIKEFLKDFLEDKEFDNLEQALLTHNDPAAFHAAHTLKGVAMNMEFGSLAQSAIALTDSLRGGRTPQTDALFLKVKEDYSQTVRIINAYLNE